MVLAQVAVIHLASGKSSLLGNWASNVVHSRKRDKSTPPSPSAFLLPAAAFPLASPVPVSASPFASLLLAPVSCLREPDADPC